MASGDGTFHYEIILSAFQFAAAAVVLRAPTVGRAARGFAAALLSANAVIPLMAVLARLDPQGPWTRLEAVADFPTPEILLLLVLWLPTGRIDTRVRLALTVGLVTVAIAAVGFAALAADPWAWGPLHITLAFAATLVSYAVAVAVLADDLARTGRWEVQWMLAAIGIRCAEFAVFFASSADAVRLLSWLPGASLAFATARVALAPRVPREAKGVIAVVLLAGLAIGTLRRWVTPDLGLPEALVTLAIGRPALMIIALAPPGVIAPFFRSTLVGLATYAGVVVAARASGLAFTSSVAAEAALGLVAAWAVLTAHRALRTRDHGTADAPGATHAGAAVAAPESPRARVLLAYLTRLPRGSKASRVELAEVVSVLPRNVHRLVEAINRLPGSDPGSPLVTWALARGRGNQLQHYYEATEEGRRVAAGWAEIREKRL